MQTAQAHESRQVGQERDNQKRGLSLDREENAPTQNEPNGQMRSDCQQKSHATILLRFGKRASARAWPLRRSL
jgi:hypothetical protein